MKGLTLINSHAVKGGKGLTPINSHAVKGEKRIEKKDRTYLVLLLYVPGIFRDLIVLLQVLQSVYVSMFSSCLFLETFKILSLFPVLQGFQDMLRLSAIHRLLMCFSKHSALAAQAQFPKHSLTNI